MDTGEFQGLMEDESVVRQGECSRQRESTGGYRLDVLMNEETVWLGGILRVLQSLLSGQQGESELLIWRGALGRKECPTGA